MNKHNTLHLCVMGLVATSTGCTELTQLGVSGELSSIRDGKSAVSAARHATKLSLGPDVFMPGYGDPKLGDLDGDGLDDLLISLVSTVEGAPGETPGMTSYLFYGRGFFPEELSLADADATFDSGARESVALGDVNGDKLADFALGDETGCEFVFGTATRFSGHYPRFTAGTKWSYSGPPPEGGVLALGLGRVHGLGDINGDGADEFLLEASLPDPESLNKLSYRQYVMEGRKGAWPTGTWDPSWAAAVYEYYRFAPVLHSHSGDANGDGYSDLFAYTNDDYRQWIFYGGPESLQGKLTSARADAQLPIIPAVDEEAKSIYGDGSAGLIGDIDGDGADDFAIRRMWGETHISYSSKARFSGVATLEPDLTFVGQDAHVVVGDFNADGLNDMLVVATPATREDESATPVVYELRGTGERLTGRKVLQPSELYQPVGYALPEGTRGNLSAVGDIDGDGSTDLVAGVAKETASDTEFPEMTLYLLPGSQKTPD